MYKEPVFDIRSIIALMPHRYPSLLIDRIIQIDPRKFIVECNQLFPKPGNGAIT